MHSMHHGGIVHLYGEDTHTLRLTSELVEPGLLRTPQI